VSNGSSAASSGTGTASKKFEHSKQPFAFTDQWFEQSKHTPAEMQNAT
jgi:hypothetical protein